MRWATRMTYIAQAQTSGITGRSLKVFYLHGLKVFYLHGLKVFCLHGFEDSTQCLPAARKLENPCDAQRTQSRECAATRTRNPAPDDLDERDEDDDEVEGIKTVGNEFLPPEANDLHHTLQREDKRQDVVDDRLRVDPPLRHALDVRWCVLRQPITALR